ncbi:MAG TPA: FG-GAP-like repeat-containing protein, partial [Thermoanaerobaculia bacterium]|nr:FG-GAP-like repeat-containing protein [Thermoanaerobaculia bacterium]
TNFAVGAAPFSLAIGDFNGDGRSDLAVANAGSADVSILLGTGTGTFGAATNIAVGAAPAAVAIGDFNGDGRIDLAVANENSNSVSILLGTGTGTFAAAPEVGVAISPISVAIGDFNNDGRSDLVVANFVSNNVSILLGTGTGTFAAATYFPVGTFPVSVAIGDFNGDGRNDLAVANEGSNNVSILLGTGTGAFGAAANFATGALPVSVATGDFNGDGRSDLAVVNSGSNSVSVLLGTGTGTFGSATDLAVGSSPFSLAIGDFNGDGRSDFAVANNFSNDVSILLGSTAPGTLAFSSATYSVSESAGAVTITVNRTGGTDCSVTVNFATSNGTATAGSDYTATSGTLTFGPGVTSQSFTVPIIDDGVNEANETFTVTLSTPGGGAVLGSPASATATIIDDDPLPTLAINNVSKAEGTGGTTNFVFTVTLTGATEQNVTFNYATADGTAIAPGDYATTSGTLGFSPGTLTRTIAVPVFGDAVTEADETFTVALSSPTNATITTATGTGTIQNDDFPPTTSASATPSPNAAGWNNTPVTVNLSAAAGSSPVQSISYTVTNGSSSTGATVSGNSVSFPVSAAGVNTITYQATDVAGNTEAAKTLIVRIDTLAPVTSAGATPAPNANGWNDAPVTVSLSAADAGSGVESVTYTVVTVSPTGTVTSTNTVAASATAFTVSANGVSTITYHATDIAGNAEADLTLVVRVDTEAPLLALPAGVTADATSPAGAIVSYTVTAADNSGLVPNIMCAPPSGTTFPVGTSTVNCTASDAAGNSSVGSFTITVNGPSAQASNLITLVQSLNLNGGTGTSLTTTLTNAINSFASGNTTSACNQIDAFISQVQAQSGKKLTTAQADQLIAAANQIRTAQGCP